MYHRAW